jgi:hypothetical protein
VHGLLFGFPIEAPPESSVIAGRRFWFNSLSCPRPVKWHSPRVPLDRTRRPHSPTPIAGYAAPAPPKRGE